LKRGANNRCAYGAGRETAANPLTEYKSPGRTLWAASRPGDLYSFFLLPWIRGGLGRSRLCGGRLGYRRRGGRWLCSGLLGSGRLGSGRLSYGRRGGRRLGGRQHDRRQEIGTQ